MMCLGEPAFFPIFNYLSVKYSGSTTIQVLLSTSFTHTIFSSSCHVVQANTIDVLTR